MSRRRATRLIGAVCVVAVVVWIALVLRKGDVPQSRSTAPEPKVEATPGIAPVTDAERSPASMPAEPTVVGLEPVGTLSVTVLGAHDKPIVGAGVAVFPRDTSRPTVLQIVIPPSWNRLEARNAPSRTNAAGQVELHGLPCDTELVVSAVTDAPTVSATTTILSGLAREAITLHVGQRGCIRGRLVWPDGTPVVEPLTRVSCLDHVERNRPPPNVIAWNDGQFELCGLPRGLVRWHIEADGEGERTVDVDAEMVDLGAIVLKDLAEVRGRVVFTDALPDYTYDRIGVRFYQGGRVTADRINVDLDGSFRVRVPHGPGSVCVEILGATVCSANFTAPQADLVIQLDDHLGELSLEHVPFRKTDAVTIQLRVVEDPASHGVVENHWFVYDNRPPNDSKRTTFTWDSDTHCRVLGIRPGTYDVFLCYERRASQLSRVTVQAGKTTAIECGSLGPGSISGRVIDSQGKPIPAARVEAQLSLEGERLNSVRAASATQEGAFQLDDMDPGVWTIYPRPLGPTASVAKQVRIVGGEHVEADIVVEPPRRLFGRITRHGEPAPEFSVLLTSAGDAKMMIGFRAETRQVQADGSFEYSSVLPGDYLLTAATEVPWRVLTRKITVQAGQDKELEWDVAAQSVRVVFSRRGVPVDDVQSAFMKTRTVETYVMEVPGQPGIWNANLDDGPALALIWTSGDNPADPAARTTFRGEEVVEASYCAGGCRAGDPVSFDVRGPSVLVRCTTPSAVRPRAYLMAVGEFREVWSRTSGPSLAWRDDGDTRRFDNVPAGATVELVGARLEGGGSYHVTVEVDASADSSLAWPPGP